jgi:hypothetical protein
LSSAHRIEDSIALYEKAQDALTCSDRQCLRLDDPSLRPAIQKAALDNHLDFFLINSWPFCHSHKTFNPSALAVAIAP